jgi:hypothetical protein
MEYLINILHEKTGMPIYMIKNFIIEKALPYFKRNNPNCLYEDYISLNRNLFGIYKLPENVAFVVETEGNPKANYNQSTHILQVLEDKYDVNMNIKCLCYYPDRAIVNLYGFYDLCYSLLTNSTLSI